MRSGVLGRARGAIVSALLAALCGACACPPLIEDYDTPQATLDLWQAHLCRDDAEGEYGCLSLDFQRSTNGFQGYYAGREDLLAREPTAAWLFKHADLHDHVVGTSLSPDGRFASIVLSAGRGDSLVVAFEREAWVTVTWDDGRRTVARQDSPLAPLVIRRGSAQWLALPRPELTDPDHIREIRFSSRWLISDIAGLAAAGAPPAGSAPAGTASGDARNGAVP